MLTFGFVGNAQQNKQAQPTPEQKAERESNKATKQLSLNDKQKAIFKQFALQRINTNLPLRQKLKTTTDAAAREVIKKDILAGRDKFHANVNSILLPEQKPKWAEIIKRKEEMGAKKQARR